MLARRHLRVPGARWRLDQARAAHCVCRPRGTPIFEPPGHLAPQEEATDPRLAQKLSRPRDLTSVE
eukprot:1204543-Prymnesium_polylepis.2